MRSPHSQDIEVYKLHCSISTSVAVTSLRSSPPACRRYTNNGRDFSRRLVHEKADPQDEETEQHWTLDQFSYSGRTVCTQPAGSPRTVWTPIARPQNTDSY